MHEEVPAGGVEVQVDDSLPTQYTARTGERIILASADEAAARFPAMAQITQVLGVRSLASLPLLVEGRGLGGFVAPRTAGHGFTPEGLRLLGRPAPQNAPGRPTPR